MKKGKKMSPRIIIELFLAVLFVHNAQGDSQLQTKPITDYTKLKTITPPKHVKRILALGDSVTEGYFAGGRKFYPFTTQLEAKLNNEFNFTRFDVLNEGITRRCAFKKLVKKVPDILVRERNRLDLVIVLGGTADFRKPRCSGHNTVVDSMLKIHNLVHKQGLKSVVVTIPECLELDTQCEKDRLRANKKLKKYAKANKENTLLCDLSAGLPMTSLFDFDRKVYWDDSVHPSKIGYDKIATLLYDVIKEEFEDKPQGKRADIFQLKKYVEKKMKHQTD